jgi:hypothetical protein
LNGSCITEARSKQISVTGMKRLRTAAKDVNLQPVQLVNSLQSALGGFDKSLDDFLVDDLQLPPVDTTNPPSPQNLLSKRWILFAGDREASQT